MHAKFWESKNPQTKKKDKVGVDDAPTPKAAKIGAQDYSDGGELGALELKNQPHEIEARKVRVETLPPMP